MYQEPENKADQIDKPAKTITNITYTNGIQADN